LDRSNISDFFIKKQKKKREKAWVKTTARPHNDLGNEKLPLVWLANKPFERGEKKVKRDERPPENKRAKFILKNRGGVTG